MKTKNTSCFQCIKYLFVCLLLLGFINLNHAQSGTDQTSSASKEKKEKNRKDEIKIYGGVNVNTLSIASDKYESVLAPGWMLGLDYKRGKFFYWQVGVRYNNQVYNLTNPNLPADSSNLLDGVFGVRNIDMPVVVGVNFLSFVSRIVGLRLFVGATPEFVLGVANNDLDITTNIMNNFNVLGQAGIGVDVTFIYLETGVNYGFGNLFNNDIQSKPVQLFVNLGFRF